MYDFNNYLSAIGLSNEQVRIDLNFLSRFTQKHLENFRYQNTYLYQQGQLPVEKREPASLQIDDIYEQLVIKNEPGYCFQNTELLYAALTEMGFHVKRHLSRVFNSDKNKIDFNKAYQSPFDHEVLSVNIEGQNYIVDTGFANNSLRYPLLWQAGEQQQGTDCYRLSMHNSDFLLELKIKDNEWLCLYKIQTQSCDFDAVVNANKNMFSSDKLIPIRDLFQKMAIVTPEKRKCLVSFKDGETFFKSYKNGEMFRERRLLDEETLSSTAQSKFGIML